MFWRSFAVAATNPQGYLFFSALLPQFIDPSAPQVRQYALLASLFATIDLVVMLTYALTGSRTTQLVGTKGARWLDRVCGGVLVALAGLLARYRRSA